MMRGFVRVRSEAGKADKPWTFPLRLVCGLALVVLLLLFRGVLIRPFLTVASPESATISIEVEAEGFSIYDEMIMLSPLTGDLTLLVSEGEVVARGTPVIRVEHPRRQTYEDRLREVREAALAWREIHQPELLSLGAQLHANADAASHAALQAKKGNDPAAVTHALDEFGAVRDSLDVLWAEWLLWCEQIDQLQRLRDGASDEIPAPRPGVVRTEFDGLENVLSWDVALTGQLLDVLSDAEPAGGLQKHPVRAEDEVRAGSPLLRIQDHLRLDALLLLPEDAPDVPVAGSRVTLRIEDEGRAVLGRVADALVQARDRDLVRVSLAEEIPYFYEHRQWRAVVQLSERRGHRVLGSSLVRRRDSDGVFVFGEDGVQWTEVEILRLESQDVIVSGLPEDMKVVQNPRLLQVARLP